MAMPCTDYWEATQVQYRSYITVQTNNRSWKLIQIRVFFYQIDRQLEAFIFAGGTHCPDYYKVHHSSIMVDSSSSCEIKIERVAHYLNVQRIVSTNIEGNNRNTISSSFSSRQVIKAPTKVEWDPALMWFSQISYITYTEWKGKIKMSHLYRSIS